MNLLTAMATFVRVVETGSFTAVAREQGSQQPAISKQIAWLEGHLGNRLIERTTRRLLFTDQALSYYHHCKGIFEAIGEAEKLVRIEQTQISGALRIAASVGLGSFQIAPHLPAFIARHPNITVDLRLSDTYVDVVAEGIDATFRLGQAGDSSVATRRLGLVRPVLVASTAYCDQHGSPATIDEIAAHRCVVISGRQNTAQWRFDDAGKSTITPMGPVTTDSGVGARALVLADAGITCLPKWLFTKELEAGTVQHILPAIPLVPTPLYVITPLSRRHSHKVKVFLDFLVDILMQGSALETG